MRFIVSSSRDLWKDSIRIGPKNSKDEGKCQAL